MSERALTEGRVGNAVPHRAFWNMLVVFLCLCLRLEVPASDAPQPGEPGWDGRESAGHRKLHLILPTRSKHPCQSPSGHRAWSGLWRWRRCWHRVMKGGLLLHCPPVAVNCVCRIFTALGWVSWLYTPAKTALFIYSSAISSFILMSALFPAYNNKFYTPFAGNKCCSLIKVLLQTSKGL